MCNIVVATDKYKGTLTAQEACKTIHSALEKQFPNALFRICPMADGGEGTARLLGTILGYKRVEIRAENSIFEPIQSEYYLSPDGRYAIIDSSAVIGIQKMTSALQPWSATTYPLGVVIKDILTKVEKVTVCIGGTSTVDCGFGMLQALGYRFFSGTKEIEYPLVPFQIFETDRIEYSEPDLSGRIDCISDVDVPLLSDDGKCMLMFAAQKGVKQEEMPKLADMIRHLWNINWSKSPVFNCQYAGAGGGLGFAIHGVIGGKATSGADAMIKAYNLFDPKPDLIITGEGRFDAQSLTGKVAGRILELSETAGIRSCVLAGCVGDDLRLENVIDTSAFYPKSQLTKNTAARRLAAACKKIIL